jgi:hypothetical protein
MHYLLRETEKTSENTGQWSWCPAGFGHANFHNKVISFQASAAM